MYLHLTSGFVLCVSVKSTQPPQKKHFLLPLLRLTLLKHTWPSPECDVTKGTDSSRRWLRILCQVLVPPSEPDHRQSEWMVRLDLYDQISCWNEHMKWSWSRHSSPRRRVPSPTTVCVCVCVVVWEKNPIFLLPTDAAGIAMCRCWSTARARVCVCVDCLIQQALPKMWQIFFSLFFSTFTIFNIHDIHTLIV